MTAERSYSMCMDDPSLMKEETGCTCIIRQNISVAGSLNRSLGEAFVAGRDPDRAVVFGSTPNSTLCGGFVTRGFVIENSKCGYIYIRLGTSVRAYTYHTAVCT